MKRTSKSTLKVGQRVVCVDAGDGSQFIQRGREYVVTAIESGLGALFVYIQGSSEPWLIRRFDIIDPENIAEIASMYASY